MACSSKCSVHAWRILLHILMGDAFDNNNVVCQVCRRNQHQLPFGLWRSFTFYLFFPNSIYVMLIERFFVFVFCKFHKIIICLLKCILHSLQTFYHNIHKINDVRKTLFDNDHLTVKFDDVFFCLNDLKERNVSRYWTGAQCGPYNCKANETTAFTSKLLILNYGIDISI